MTDHFPVTEVVLTSDLFDDCIDIESLSPAALSVLKAYVNACGWLDGPMKTDGCCIAAVLRAAADQVVPTPRLPLDSCCDVSTSAIRAEILAIATALDGGAQ